MPDPRAGLTFHQEIQLHALHLLYVMGTEFVTSEKGWLS